MATVTVTGLIKDETGLKDSRDWAVLSPAYREGSEGSVVTMRKQVVRVVAGVFSAELEPGPAVVINPDGRSYAVTVPDEDSNLWDLIEIAAALPPDTPADALAAAITAYLDSHGGGLVDIQQGTDITVTSTNPLKPVVSLGPSVRPAIAAAADAASAAQTTAAAKYTKPGTGIPAADLAAAVQALLTAAGTAVQPAALATAMANLVDGAPATLDTLKEIAAAVNNDPAFYSTLTTTIAAKYTKPGTGIPVSDLAAAIQTVINAPLAENHYKVWTGSGWPARPSDALPVIWIGGAAPTNAPPDHHSGDTWIPASGDGINLGTVLTALQLITAAANTIPYFSAAGVAGSLALSTSSGMGGGTPSDTTLSTQKAVKAYIDAVIAAVVTNGTLINPTITNYTEMQYAIGNTGTAVTLALTNGTVQSATLTGNCTFTMPTAAAGKSLLLYLSTGAGSFTGTFTGVKWPGGAAPTITATASKLDILTFSSDGANWYGSFAQNYTP